MCRVTVRLVIVRGSGIDVETFRKARFEDMEGQVFPTVLGFEASDGETVLKFLSNLGRTVISIEATDNTDNDIRSVAELT